MVGTHSDLQRRARGSLFGIAIGDAMGAPCEGMSARAIRQQYGVITDFLNDSSTGTDDTDFTMFNAYLITTYGRDITLAQVEYEWRDKLLSGQYYYRPGGFSDVISTRNLQAGVSAPHSGAFNHQMWSDGVAMAISPAGIACAGRPDAAAKLAAVLGSVSNARDGIYAAQAIAAAISVGMVGASPSEMVHAAAAAIPSDCWTARALARLQALNLPSVEDVEHALDIIDQQLVVHWWPWADLVTEAVPVALAVFLACQGQFALAVPTGVRLGRDADTIAAIVGSLAGAYGGEHAIPPLWKQRVTVASGKCIGFVAGHDLADVADQLVGLYDHHL